MNSIPSSEQPAPCRGRFAPGKAGLALGLLIPEAELLLRHVVVEGVALLAAADAALVGGHLATGVAAPAVLEHAGVPLDAQRVAAHAGLPAVLAQPAALQLRQLRALRQHLEHGAVHACGGKHRQASGWREPPETSPHSPQAREVGQSFQGLLGFKSEWEPHLNLNGRAKDPKERKVRQVLAAP